MRWQRIVFSVTVTEGLLTEVSEKRKGCGRKAIPPVVARIFSGDSTSPLTREASLVRGERLLAFCNGCEDDSIRCNGRGKQGTDALSVCAQGLCKDAKPTKHTQTLTLRKARGIVRVWEGWCKREIVVRQSLR